jgi:hypothetical protein
MSATAAALTLEQKEIYQSMSGDWRKQAEAAIKLQRSMVDDLIWKKYKLGEIVRDMRQNEARYGESAVEKLAIVLGSAPSELWECQRLATCYTEESLTKLMERAGKTGRRIQWSHLRQLADMSESHGAGAAKTRRELETQIINEGLTARDLTHVIQQRLGSRSRGSGRTPAPPRTPAAGLQQITGWADGFTKRCDGYDEHVFRALETAGEDQLSEATLKHLEEAKEAQLQARAKLELSINRTESVLNRVSRVLQQAAGAAPAPATTTAAPKASTASPAKKTDKKTTKPAAAEAASRINNTRQRRRTEALA